jgi:CheY-like chemotaxis protein
MRVLFVEDNQMNRRVIAEMLRAGGVDMDEAEDGPQGLAMIDANTYDLSADGPAHARHGRPDRHPRDPHPHRRQGQLPVIVVTADSGATLEADCQAAGADDVIRKPVDLSTLFSTIGDLIARKGEGGLVLS